MACSLNSHDAVRECVSVARASGLPCPCSGQALQDWVQLELVATVQYGQDDDRGCARSCTIASTPLHPGAGEATKSWQQSLSALPCAMSAHHQESCRPTRDGSTRARRVCWPVGPVPRPTLTRIRWSCTNQQEAVGVGCTVRRELWAKPGRFIGPPWLVRRKRRIRQPASQGQADQGAYLVLSTLPNCPTLPYLTLHTLPPGSLKDLIKTRAPSHLFLYRPCSSLPLP